MVYLRSESFAFGCSLILKDIIYWKVSLMGISSISHKLYNYPDNEKSYANTDTCRNGGRKR